MTRAMLRATSTPTCQLLFSYSTLPPTMVMSTSEPLQALTTAETGSVAGVWCEPDRSTAMTSASLPTSRLPTLSSMRSARAPPMVAISSMVEDFMKLRGFTARWMSMPMCISEIMSVESVAAGLSVPRPTRRPLFRNSASGATPMPSWALMRGQLATETSYSLSLATSWSST